MIIVEETQKKTIYDRLHFLANEMTLINILIIFLARYKCLPAFLTVEDLFFLEQLLASI